MANFFKPTTKKQKMGQRINLTISHINHAGIGVSRLKKLPVFVEGALAGESVEVKVVEQKSKYIKAQLIHVITPSAARVEPECKHFHVCGGCDLQHVNYDTQLALKQQTIISHFARHGFAEQLPWQQPITSEPWHYRRKARIGVQYNKHSEAIVGFRQKATNHLTTIKSCPVLVEPLSDIFTVLTELIDQLRVKEAIGHVEVVSTELETEQELAKTTTLVVRMLKRLSSDDFQLWQRYAQQHNWQVLIDDGKALMPIGAYLAEVNIENSGNDDISLDMPSALHYFLSDDIKISFTAQDFIQVNHNVNQTMVATAIEWLALSAQDVVLDLFCGLGNFSLPIAQAVKEVVGIEGVQSMVDKASENAINNQLTNCHFYQADLNSDWQQSNAFEQWGDKAYSKAILDPARAGALSAVEQLIPLKVKTLVYVSCDVSTLARDAKLLAEHGYKIEKIGLMDMFSQTKHIETMVLFSL